LSNCSPFLGAVYLGAGKCRFRVWAPKAERVEVRIVAPEERVIPLVREERGYFEGLADAIAPGTRYFFRLDGLREYPDPASRFQPEGVHGPSEVFDPSALGWSDAGWKGRELDELVVYEFHAGTFTPEGTLDAAIARLDALAELGVTAVEPLPLAQFPGQRNWGYDGVYPFAVQNSYGGPAAFARFVDAAHRRGLAVLVDVVYNHLGPEGNYFAEFAPYFTARYRTPWGEAINFDGPHSDEVRRYFIENALWWVTEMHADGLRCDAIHGIVDTSAQPFLAELTAAVHRRAAELGRRILVIAESDLNDPRVIRPREAGGYGFDAQWSDDFHHALHTLVTGERDGYYEDFGKVAHLADAFRRGYAYAGEYSRFRKRRHGAPTGGLAPGQFVVCAQNHDQVGNRMRGERLTQIVSWRPAKDPNSEFRVSNFETLKLAAATVLLSPFVPLLFMGEEYGETAPFLYFVSHSDPGLIEAVRQGRREEFAAFEWQGTPPDPQDETSFLRSKLRWELQQQPGHRELRAFYHELLGLRRELPALRCQSFDELEVCEDEARSRLVALRGARPPLLLALNFGDAPAQVKTPAPAGKWHKRLDSAAAEWGGAGSDAPDSLDCHGELEFVLPAKAAVLFEHSGKGRAAGKKKSARAAHQRRREK
jgi:maltooligosyltrehalose trehalohydrolase